jgi:hypothetical protein
VSKSELAFSFDDSRRSWAFEEITNRCLVSGRGFEWVYGTRDFFAAGDRGEGFFIAPPGNIA